MKKLKEQLSKLKIPYPQKLWLAVEIEDHLLQDPSSQDDFDLFSEDEISEFYEIHNNVIFKYLDRLNPKTRKIIETIMLGMPLAGLLYFFGKENFMLEFVKEGGFGMFPILLLGVVLLLREFHSFLRLVIVKDHSQSSLKIDSTALLIGGFALVALGIGSTALGLYYTAKATLAANSQISLFIEGVKESMGPVIVSSCFAALVFVLHFATRRLMVTWKAPVI